MIQSTSTAEGPSFWLDWRIQERGDKAVMIVTTHKMRKEMKCRKCTRLLVSSVGKDMWGGSLWRDGRFELGENSVAISIDNRTWAIVV